MSEILLGPDLDALRQVGDPAADAVASLLRIDAASSGSAVGVLHAILHSHRARANDSNSASATDGPSEAARSAVRDWFSEDVHFPEWVDQALVRRGQEVFQQWALYIGSALFVASLPTAYAAADGVQVLALASELVGSQVRRRTAETGQMLIDVHEFTPGGLVARSDGVALSSQAINTIRTVRLLHACVRADLAQNPQWNSDWGVPVNQEDLLGTQLTFTTAVFQALERMGLVLTADERRASLHLWAAIGTVLGVQETRWLDDIERAAAAWKQIDQRLWKQSPEGAALMKYLLAEMELGMPRGLKKVPRTVVRHAISDRVADMIDVPDAAWWSPVLGPLAGLGRRASSIPGVRRLSAWPLRLVGLAMYRMYIDGGLDGGRARFRVTEEQKRRWDLRGFAAWRVRARERRTAKRLKHGESA
jgi:ER-bound oxygenase mpaB/B'/Rubber oxygenase, catalytic domain